MALYSCVLIIQQAVPLYTTYFKVLPELIGPPSQSAAAINIRPLRAQSAGAFTGQLEGELVAGDGHEDGTMSALKAGLLNPKRRMFCPQA